MLIDFVCMITSQITISTLSQIRDSNIMSMKTQFLFMIADTKGMDEKILMELEKSVDGENVAFIYNSSMAASTCNARFV